MLFVKSVPAKKTPVHCRSLFFYVELYCIFVFWWKLEEALQIEKIIDYTAFMAETGLDRDAIKELYQVFHDEMLEEKEKLLCCFSGNDFEMLGKTVHNVKGISGSFKAGQVYEQATLMGFDIRKGKFEDIGSRLANLTQSIDCAIREIKKYIEM